MKLCSSILRNQISVCKIQQPLENFIKHLDIFHFQSLFPVPNMTYIKCKLLKCRRSELTTKLTLDSNSTWKPAMYLSLLLDKEIRKIRNCAEVTQHKHTCKVTWGAMSSKIPKHMEETYQHILLHEDF